MKKMTSKFNGKCFECSIPIPKGSPILWSKPTGAKHKVCPPAGTIDCAAVKAANLSHVYVTELGDFSEVYEMFASAAKTNKFPKIVIDTDGIQFSLYVSGPDAKIEGVINVKGGKGGWHTEWYGRITESGAWTHWAGVDERMADALSKLAMDPVGAVAEFGHLNGRCCFCSIEVTDETSEEVGYGPTCAKKWGLPHGTKAKAIVGHTHTASLEKGPHVGSKIFAAFENVD